VFHATEKDNNSAWCVFGSVIVLLHSVVEVKFLACLLHVTHSFVMRIISYANVVYCICI